MILLLQAAGESSGLGELAIILILGLIAASVAGAMLSGDDE